MKQKNLTHYMVTSSAIAAIYIVLTMVCAPISFGPVQLRVAEVLCILPAFTPAAVPGLFIGCLLSNILCSAAVMDIIFGSLATLIGAIGSYALRKQKFLVCLPPIIANTIIIPWVLRYAYGTPEMIGYLMLTIGAGEVLAIGILGNILMVKLESYKKILFENAVS